VDDRYRLFVFQHEARETVLFFQNQRQTVYQHLNVVWLGSQIESLAEQYFDQLETAVAGHDVFQIPILQPRCHGGQAAE
jgi:hypothetical protein